MGPLKAKLVAPRRNSYGHEAEEGILRAFEEGERAGEAASEGDQNDGDDEAVVLAEIFAIAGDGGELAGPEGDGVGGVGLDGEESGFDERGEDEEAASACDGVDEAAEACGEGQEDVAEDGGVHCLKGTGCRLQVTGSGSRKLRTCRLKTRVAEVRLAVDFGRGASFQNGSGQYFGAECVVDWH